MQALGCGATAVSVLVRGRKLYVTWLGDSQVAMCCGGKMVKLMDPHKPEVGRGRRKVLSFLLRIIFAARRREEADYGQ